MALALTGVKPIGSTSATLTGAVVALEPLLLTTMLYAPLEPRVKLPVCVLVRLRSGATPPTVTLELLLLGFGSLESEAVMVAV